MQAGFTTFLHLPCPHKESHKPDKYNMQFTLILKTSQTRHKSDCLVLLEVFPKRSSSNYLWVCLCTIIHLQCKNGSLVAWHQIEIEESEPSFEKVNFWIPFSAWLPLIIRVGSVLSYIPNSWWCALPCREAIDHFRESVREFALLHWAPTTFAFPQTKKPFP